MIHILLVCSAGMSTSLLVKKMEEKAKEINLESKIWAVATDAADASMAEADVVLIGPQIKFMIDQISEKAKNYNIPVAPMDPKDYGTCNSVNILKQAIRLHLENKKESEE